jgi:transaldolase
MSIRSLVASGTKVWLDSIDPALIISNKASGATGATSNPIIISDLLNTGRFDQDIARHFQAGLDDEATAWAMTDQLVSNAMNEFRGVWQQTACDDGWVSFELDPLIEDTQLNLPHAERVRRYVELGKKWGIGRENRMIKVPATPAGIDALEDLSAAGLTLNVTLIFSERQYLAARDAVWRGAQKRKSLETFKSVYSIFVSRVDVYTLKNVPALSPAAQGMVGIVNVKRLWKLNQDFWKTKNLKLKQEIIFASTGTKLATDAPDKYVDALAGSDIQTNPPATNDAVEKLGRTYSRKVDQLPPAEVLSDIDAKVDQKKLEEVLMAEGVAKFADPHKQLLKTIAGKRAAMK